MPKKVLTWHIIFNKSSYFYLQCVLWMNDLSNTKMFATERCFTTIHTGRYYEDVLHVLKMENGISFLFFFCCCCYFCYSPNQFSFQIRLYFFVVFRQKKKYSILAVKLNELGRKEIRSVSFDLANNAMHYMK